MIDLVFSGMCKDCTYADLDIVSLGFRDINKGSKIWAVRCDHEEACKHMKLVTLDEKYNSNNTDTEKSNEKTN